MSHESCQCSGKNIGMRGETRCTSCAKRHRSSSDSTGPRCDNRKSRSNDRNNVPRLSVDTGGSRTKEIHFEDVSYLLTETNLPRFIIGELALFGVITMFLVFLDKEFAVFSAVVGLALPVITLIGNIPTREELSTMAKLHLLKEITARRPSTNVAKWNAIANAMNIYLFENKQFRLPSYYLSGEACHEHFKKMFLTEQVDTPDSDLPHCNHRGQEQFSSPRQFFGTQEKYQWKKDSRHNYFGEKYEFEIRHQFEDVFLRRSESSQNPQRRDIPSKRDPHREIRPIIDEAVMTYQESIYEDWKQQVEEAKSKLQN